MPTRPKRICSYPGCPCFAVVGSKCEAHAKQSRQAVDRQRGTAHQRGYTGRWNRYSKWFLKQPGNQICKLRIDGRCTLAAGCVDHIKPVPPDDPLFWEPSNHQASCLVCNSIKGNREMQGTEWQV